MGLRASEVRAIQRRTKDDATNAFLLHQHQENVGRIPSTNKVAGEFSSSIFNEQSCTDALGFRGGLTIQNRNKKDRSTKTSTNINTFFLFMLSPLRKCSEMSNRVTRGLWIVGGSFSLILGFIGIFLPLLPTIPFLLLAAACYFRGSERMHKRLLGNKWFGNYIKNYQEGKGIPLKAKILSISLLWLTIGYSAVFLMHILIVRLILILIAIGVTTHILSIKTSNQ